MKSLFFSASILSAILLASCNERKNEAANGKSDSNVEQPVKFTTTEIKDSLSKTDQLNGKSRSYTAHYALSILIPDKGHDWLEGEMKDIYQTSIANEKKSAPAMSMDIRSVVENTIRDDFNKKYEDFLKDPGAESDIMQSDEELKYGISFNDKGFVVINACLYLMVGESAHGLSDSSYYCLDILNKKRLKFNDIIAIDAATLQALTTKAVKAQNVPDLSANEIFKDIASQLLKGNPEYEKRFYFNQSGIYISSAAFGNAVGIVNIFIPFADLKPYMKKDFASRINL